jgi:hypothetical protein
VAETSSTHLDACTGDSAAGDGINDVADERTSRHDDHRVCHRQRKWLWYDSREWLRYDSRHGGVRDCRLQDRLRHGLHHGLHHRLRHHRLRHHRLRHRVGQPAGDHRPTEARKAREVATCVPKKADVELGGSCSQRAVGRRTVATKEPIRRILWRIDDHHVGFRQKLKKSQAS